MCARLHIIEESKLGYLARCEQCETYNLAFGTLLQVLTEDDILLLSEQLAKSRSRVSEDTCPRAKTFLYRLNEAGTVQMILSLNEVIELESMVNKTLTLMEAKKILDAE